MLEDDPQEVGSNATPIPAPSTPLSPAMAAFAATAAAEDRTREAQPLDPNRDGLTPEIREKLDTHFDEFEEGVKAPGFDAVQYLRTLVGPEFLLAATAHLVGRRLERMRSAARGRGFDIGV